MFKRSMVSAIDFTDLPPIGDATGFYYGLGVGSYDYAGHQVIEKGGALAGVRTIIVMVPDENAGIVVLANLNLTAFPEAVRAYFLNQLLGIDPEAYQKKILARNEDLKKTDGAPTTPRKIGRFNVRCSCSSASTRRLLRCCATYRTARCQIDSARQISSDVETLEERRVHDAVPRRDRYAFGQNVHDRRGRRCDRLENESMGVFDGRRKRTMEAAFVFHRTSNDRLTYVASHVSC